MKLNIHSLKKGENRFQYQSAKDTWLGEVLGRLEDDGQKIEGNCALDLKITQLHPDYVLQGTIEFKAVLSCARCAEAFSLPIQYSFDAAFSYEAPAVTGQKDGGGLTNEDDSVDVTVFNGQEIDLDPVVEEQVVLSIPYQVLCHQDCKGICQQCGQNQNVAKCACSKERGSGAFSVLEQLKH